MRGLITDCHIDAAEALFPGIRQFYEGLLPKPRTFLELLWEYEHSSERSTVKRPGRGRRKPRQRA